MTEYAVDREQTLVKQNSTADYLRSSAHCTAPSTVAIQLSLGITILCWNFKLNGQFS